MQSRYLFAGGIREIKETFDGNFQYVSDVEERFQGNAGGHVRSLQVADVGAAQIALLCQLKLCQYRAFLR